MTKFKTVVICSAALLGSGAFAADQPPKLRLAEVERAAPTSYKADLTLDPEKDHFTGSVVINLNLPEPLQTLWLNQEQITIQSASLTSGNRKFQAKTLPGGDDYVGFRFDSPVPPGSAQITITYTGTVITKNSSAVFRQQESGNWYIFSQFEATDARGAFPCFDEPSYKVPWQLTLHVPAQDSAISNTSALSEKVNGATRTYVFRETKPLPSYLVAFGVGPFEYVDGGPAGKNHVPVRIVVPKGHAGEAKYAAEVTATIIAQHEDYFGIPYPYDKADQVAVPDTSGWGAMENPGMVTYAQNIILAKPETDSINRQREYADTAAHELAHQWFGDLVTTAWWDDIWLNEAFATWMEEKRLAEWKPEWKTRVGDVNGKLGAEREDSLISARKIRQPIETKDDINNAFDGITYVKGAAVIGMFENWMGAEDFRKGVHNYMKQYTFKTATAPEFLDSLSSVGKKNVGKSFATFLNQPGVPIVSVALDCKGKNPALHLEQQRFLPLGSKGSTDQTWSIPVCVRYGSGNTGQSDCTLMTEKTMDWPLKSAKSCPAWVQANDKAVGYYRVDYQGGLLGALSQGNPTERLSAPERVDFMGNARALSTAGKLSASDALSLVETFHTDPERQVLESAIGLAESPRNHLVDASSMPNYQRFLLKNFQAKAHELGWVPKPGEPDDVKLLRPEIVETVATTGGDQAFAAEAKTLTEKWLEDHKAVDPNMVNAVIDTAAYYGDKALFDRFLAEFKKSDDRLVRGRLIGAMDSFRDRAAIEAGMKALLDGDIPFMEGAGLLFNGQREDATRKVAFKFLQTNFDAVTSKMPTGGGFDFGSVLPQVGGSFCDTESRGELQSFFKPRVDKFVGAPRALDQVLESIDLCIANKAAQAASVTAFLQKY